jgi:hypothetical protein
VRSLMRTRFLIAITLTACPAFGQSRAEKRFEFRQDEKSLYEGLKSTTTNTRVRSAIYLWTNFKGGRNAAEEVMEHDPDLDVRQRIAEVLAAQQKAPKAIKVLRETLEKNDIRTQEGAMAYLIAAGSLRDATKEAAGIDKALKILTAPPDWFADVNSSPMAYAQKDAPRLSAASYLAANVDSRRKTIFQDALQAYIHDVQLKMESSSGQERKYWEARFPTALDIALRVGLDSFVASFDGKETLFKEPYEKKRFERVIKRAQGKAK